MQRLNFLPIHLKPNIGVTAYKFEYKKKDKAQQRRTYGTTHTSEIEYMDKTKNSVKNT